MSFTQYTLPITWVPDPTYINSFVDNQYAAWRIGFSTELGIAIWLIQPFVESPSPPLADLLPSEVDYSSTDFTVDTPSYGVSRSILNNESFDSLSDKFENVPRLD